MKKAKAAAKAPKAKEMTGELPELHKAEKDGPQDYEVKDAAETLMRAEDIKKNEKLMPHVHKHLSKKMHSLKELKKLANNKAMEEGEHE